MKLKKGKWYFTNKYCEERIVKINRVKYDSLYNTVYYDESYEISNKNVRTMLNSSFSNTDLENSFVPAKRKQIEKFLIEIARNKYIDNQKLESFKGNFFWDDGIKTDNGMNPDYKFNSDGDYSFYYSKKEDTLTNWGRGLGCIYNKGEWAKEIIEKQPFKENQWLTDTVSDSKIIFRFNGINKTFTKTNEYYQVHESGNIDQGKSNNYSHLKTARIATDDEIKEILTIVAKDKGFVKGFELNRIENHMYSGEVDYYDYTNHTNYDTLESLGAYLYEDGKWSTFKEKQTLYFGELEVTIKDDLAITKYGEVKAEDIKVALDWLIIPPRLLGTEISIPLDIEFGCQKGTIGELQAIYTALTTGKQQLSKTVDIETVPIGKKVLVIEAKNGAWEANGKIGTVVNNSVSIKEGKGHGHSSDYYYPKILLKNGDVWGLKGQVEILN